jgi:ubiquinone/menaquinone biosynthesis C-methylase UbiE
MLAINGCDVTGIDLVEDAINDAKAKAIRHHVKVNFVVGNVLQMDRLFIEAEFDTIIDSGLFHVMTDEERPLFAWQIYRVLKQGGKYFMLCFSDKEPGTTDPGGFQKLKLSVPSRHFSRLYI